MALVDSQTTVKELLEEDGELAVALLGEAIENLISGEPAVARLLLRDLVNGTIGFEKLAIATEIPPKSLHRMLSAKGNPAMGNLSAIIKALKKELDVELTVQNSLKVVNQVS